MAVGYHVARINRADENYQISIGRLKCEYSEMILVSLRRGSWDTNVLRTEGYLACPWYGARTYKSLWDMMHEE